MTPAEQNLHDIVNSFARLPRVIREVCPTCLGRGKVPSSTYARPELHIETCSACGGSGSQLRETTP